MSKPVLQSSKINGINALFRPLTYRPNSSPTTPNSARMMTPEARSF